MNEVKKSTGVVSPPEELKSIDEAPIAPLSMVESCIIGVTWVSATPMSEST